MKTLECILRNVSKLMQRKHYVSHYFLLRFREVGNHSFPLRKMQCVEVQKRKHQILINTVVYEDFWSALRETLQISFNNYWILQ